MPANLNALIRYKTINACLYGGKRKWSIDELRERCSDAMAENRGRYTGVSERTIRDDIRVMRSDILDFNAPIKQEGGLYFYSDPGYSILSIHITDAGLAEQIFMLLMKLRDKVSHPEMEVILRKLCGLLDRKYEPVFVKKARIELREREIRADKMPALREDVKYELEDNVEIKRVIVPGNVHASRSSRGFDYMRDWRELLWGDILMAVVSGRRP